MQPLPPPAAIVARTLPGGLPFLRDALVQRTGFGRNQLDPDATPGDPGLFGPGSATWQLMGHPSAALAGLRAALLQALSAPIPTATHSTGTFERDFMGRVGRTGVFVQQQNLGLIEERLRQRDAGFLSRRKLAGWPIEKFSQVQLGCKACDPLADIRHGVELREDRKILAYRQAHRHINIRAFKVHPVQHAIAFARHLGTKHLTTPDVGVTSPMIIAIVVVLPAPLPPNRPVTEPTESLNDMPSTASTAL